MRDELNLVLEQARKLAVEEIPAFLGELEMIRVIALARLNVPTAAPPPDERVDIEEAARRLGVSTHYLYRHHKEFSFCKPEGRKLLFSAQGISAYIKRAR